MFVGNQGTCACLPAPCGHGHLNQLVILGNHASIMTLKSWLIVATRSTSPLLQKGVEGVA